MAYVGNVRMLLRLKGREFYVENVKRVGKLVRFVKSGILTRNCIPIGKFVFSVIHQCQLGLSNSLSIHIPTSESCSRSTCSNSLSKHVPTSDSYPSKEMFR